MDLRVISPSPLRLAVRLDPGDPCFNGHFPDNPVAPGTLILGMCLEAARTLPGRGGALSVRRFSFSRFAGPGEYEIALDERGGDIDCTMSRGGTVYARGRIGS
jgi:3-hydroxyacyl-[acyl-carrier-protein] dehydratase